MIDKSKLPDAFLAQEYVDFMGLPALPDSDAFKQQLVDVMSKQYGLDLMTYYCRRDAEGVQSIRDIWNAAWERYDDMRMDVLGRRMKAIQADPIFKGTTRKDECLREMFTVMLLKDIQKEFK